MKLYLAGPMSGYENHNFPAFREAARVLREQGHEVISPAELNEFAASITGESTPPDYAIYLPGDFAAIAECDDIALLPGFQNSVGVTAEIHFALITGKPCYLFDKCFPESKLFPGWLWWLVSANAARQIGMKSVGDVRSEREAQDEKWGQQNHSDEWWLAILGEEFGELSQAILHDKFGGKAAGTVRDELVQTAAVAEQWIDCIDRRETRPD